MSTVTDDASTPAMEDHEKRLRTLELAQQRAERLLMGHATEDNVWVEGLLQTMADTRKQITAFLRDDAAQRMERTRKVDRFAKVVLGGLGTIAVSTFTQFWHTFGGDVVRFLLRGHP